MAETMFHWVLKSEDKTVRMFRQVYRDDNAGVTKEIISYRFGVSTAREYFRRDGSDKVIFTERELIDEIEKAKHAGRRRKASAR